MQSILVKTQLEQRMLKHIWSLTNPNLSSVFSLPMALAAIHLACLTKCNPNLQLPESMPVECSISASDDGQSQS